MKTSMHLFPSISGNRLSVSQPDLKLGMSVKVPHKTMPEIFGLIHEIQSCGLFPPQKNYLKQVHLNLDTVEKTGAYYYYGNRPNLSSTNFYSARFHLHKPEEEEILYDYLDTNYRSPYYLRPRLEIGSTGNFPRASNKLIALSIKGSLDSVKKVMERLLPKFDNIKPFYSDPRLKSIYYKEGPKNSDFKSLLVFEKYTELLPFWVKESEKSYNKIRGSKVDLYLPKSHSQK
jgi:hypothetical protein